MKRYRKLIAAEEKIILQAHTDPPGQGEYTEETAAGIYVCRQCDTPLYVSSDKFNACGWPSFDDAIPSAVVSKPDPDGERTEIICAACGGHLGHVFNGERFTFKNVRHCVNSSSLLLVPAISEEEWARAIVAAGCFWGVEDAFSSLPGVVHTKAGYTGGNVAYPTYQEVCTGLTGHFEAVEIQFDPEILTYQRILEHFFEIHDYRDRGGQGVDRGSQYHSGLFYLTRAQEKTALEEIKKRDYPKNSVATVVCPARSFYPAEDYHQCAFRHK